MLQWIKTIFSDEKKAWDVFKIPQSIVQGNVEDGCIRLDFHAAGRRLIW